MARHTRETCIRAGLIEGYDHSCRRCKRKGTPHVERHPDNEERRCPRCGMRLWMTAIPRPMRFHDLRHYPEPQIIPRERMVRPRGRLDEAVDAG
jgi:DNA-directed RNA polymerase subunit RPC12/RpoP